MLHAAWYPARLYKYYVEGVKRNKIIINEYLSLHLRLLLVMSEVSYFTTNSTKQVKKDYLTIGCALMLQNLFCISPCGKDMYSFPEHVLCLSLEVPNAVLKIIRFAP